MAGIGQTLRGTGLAMAQQALVGLGQNPERLERARARFDIDDLPPAYSFHRSGTTTRSPSRSPPAAGQLDREEQRFRLALARDNSKPYYQFEHQQRDEEERMYEAEANGANRLHAGSNITELAYGIVKKRWDEQGIWNLKWDEFASGKWKHEEPLDLDTGLEVRPEAGPSASIFSFFPKESQIEARRPSRSDTTTGQVNGTTSLQRQREREASRPFHQFIYQITTERERIQGFADYAEGAEVRTRDINTTAYENIKDIWSKRGIWNSKWGILPGMVWKHEVSLDEPAAEIPVAVPAETLPSARWLFFESSDLFSPHAINLESSHRSLGHGGGENVPSTIDILPLGGDESDHQPINSQTLHLSEERQTLPVPQRTSNVLAETVNSYGDSILNPSGSNHASSSGDVGRGAIESPPPGDVASPRRSRRLQAQAVGSPDATSSGNRNRSHKDHNVAAGSRSNNRGKPSGISKKKTANLSPSLSSSHRKTRRR